MVASVGRGFGSDALGSAKFKMAIFLTGSTGYLGSYLVAGLFTGHAEKLNLLVRAKTEQEARERLWQSLQLHFRSEERRVGKEC